MKPAKRRKQENKAGEQGCSPSEPAIRQGVNHRDGSAARYDTQKNQRCIRVVKNETGHAPQIDVKEVPGRMRLMDGRIEAGKRQRVVYRIDVIEVMAAKQKTG